MKKSRILDADKLLGTCDMGYDPDVLEYNRITRDYDWRFPMFNPLELEREADRFLEETLAKIK